MSAPQLTVQAQGQGNIDSDYLNGLLQGCDNLAELRAFVGETGMQVYARGVMTPDDGGQGNFFWSPNAVGPDDNFNVILPPAAASGGWVRLQEGSNGGPVSCTATGTNAYVLTPITGSPVVGAYVDHQLFLWDAPSTSTGLVTANVSGLGAVAVYAGGTQVGSGGITAGSLIVMAYDSTVPSFDVISAGGGGGSAGTVTNSQLAPMAPDTIKGNPTGSSASPQDMTGAVTTALLSAFIGDSGSGGTQGVVPAPPSGSAAAGKFLSAAGDFAVPGIPTSASSLTGNGYLSLPVAVGGPVILQWGTTPSIPGGSTGNVSFPTPFASQCFAVVITATSGTNTSQSHDSVRSVSTTIFTMENAAPTAATFYFMAIGV